MSVLYETLLRAQQKGSKSGKATDVVIPGPEKTRFWPERSHCIRLRPRVRSRNLKRHRLRLSRPVKIVRGVFRHFHAKWLYRTSLSLPKGLRNCMVFGVLSCRIKKRPVLCFALILMDGPLTSSVSCGELCAGV